jgi:hypothetical protein
MQWKVFWSPEGRCIATVEAKTARQAKRKAPMPYRKYLGEIYVELVETTDEPVVLRLPFEKGKQCQVTS